MANLGALENRTLAPARNRSTIHWSSSPYCSHCTDWAILTPVCSTMQCSFLATEQRLLIQVQSN